MLYYLAEKECHYSPPKSWRVLYFGSAVTVPLSPPKTGELGPYQFVGGRKATTFRMRIAAKADSRVKPLRSNKRRVLILLCNAIP